MIECFDSILVRLKVIRCDGIQDSTRLKHTFRFHTGSIKSFMKPDTVMFASHNRRFRFHTGSIKRHNRLFRHTARRDIGDSFDSILVRLKAVIEASTHSRSHNRQVRFHTGSIKSTENTFKSETSVLFRFRFHTGSIKS